MTDYSSSSEDSDTTDEDDDEEVDQEAGEESTSGPEDSRAVYVHNLISGLALCIDTDYYILLSMLKLCAYFIPV